MEFSDNVFGGYLSKPIKIRQFQTENAFRFEHVKISKVTNRIILQKMKEICPDADLSNVTNEMKCCNAQLQKYNFQDMFYSPETISSRYLLPIYNTINCDLRTLQVAKNDVYQTKRTKLYTALPPFTPRGNIVAAQTLLITISLYYPFHWANNQEPDHAVIPRCKCVFQFHDNQTLHDLKNAFKCENVDSEISGDISENPHKPLEFITNNDLKHALFYINKNIYVDNLPDEVTKNHAKTMKEWTQTHGHFIGDILSMDTKLLDLEVRIGEPYVYQHLGQCEHLFIFNEIKFAQTNDCLGKHSYPRVISVAKEKLKNCIFCSKCVSSVVMVCDDDRTPVSVNHMCEPCFMSYNYDHFGDKIANFKAYRAIKMRK